MTGPPAIGLVLGAGGTPGGAFIRAGLAALAASTGYRPEMSATVIGTSVGALNAARIPAEPSTPPLAVADAVGDLAQRLAPTPRSLLDRLVPAPRQILGRLVGRLAPRGSHAPGYPVASPPYHPGVRVVSCRRSDGARRITPLDRAADPTAELYASAAVPAFAPPVLLDGTEHVDGAVWSTTNADLVGPDDHDVLIVIAPMVPGHGGSLVHRAHRSAMLAEVEPWVRAEKPVLILVPSEDALINRSETDAFAADARRQVQAALDGA